MDTLDWAAIQSGTFTAVEVYSQFSPWLLWYINFTVSVIRYYPSTRLSSISRDNLGVALPITTPTSPNWWKLHAYRFVIEFAVLSRGTNTILMYCNVVAVLIMATVISKMLSKPHMIYHNSQKSPKASLRLWSTYVSSRTQTKPIMVAFPSYAESKYFHPLLATIGISLSRIVQILYYESSLHLKTD